jgi:uncharacterized integral membrane protein (TIGR00698 family)
MASERQEIPNWQAIGRETSRLLPGIGLALAVALAAVGAEALSWQGLGLRLPATVLALLIGMIGHRLSQLPAIAPGLIFSVKKLLRWAIALLGLRIAIADILGLGVATAVLVVAAMALTLAAGLWLARLFGRSAAYGALAGGATAVCGASAALAIATVLPPSKENEPDTAFVVLVCNALATVAMILYPLLTSALHFDDRTAGVLLGATIHDVAQVVGAGLAVSDRATDVATIVKLFRVFLLLPVVLGIGWYFAGRGGAAAGAKVPVPVFAIVFLALAGLNSLAIVPGVVRALLLEASRWGLLIAIAALGLNTSLAAMVRLGWRHIAVMSLTALVILLSVLVLLLLER